MYRNFSCGRNLKVRKGTICTQLALSLLCILSQRAGAGEEIPEKEIHRCSAFPQVFLWKTAQAPTAEQEKSDTAIASLVQLRSSKSSESAASPEHACLPK